MNRFEIFNETDEDLDLEEERKVLEYALKFEKVEDAEFNVIFVDEKKIRDINRKYRGIDRVTDVISFALEDNEDMTFEFGRLLGDIYICVKRMKEQAQEYGHSLMREQAFLSVHGLLHLLGYDHMNEEDEKIMFKKQEMILDGYGLKR